MIYHETKATLVLGKPRHEGTNCGGKRPLGPYHSPFSIFEKYILGITSFVRW